MTHAATTDLLRTGQRFLQMNRQLHWVLAQNGLLSALTMLTVNPVQRFSQQIVNSLPVANQPVETTQANLQDSTKISTEFPPNSKLPIRQVNPVESIAHSPLHHPAAQRPDVSGEAQTAQSFLPMISGRRATSIAPDSVEKAIAHASHPTDSHPPDQESCISGVFTPTAFSQVSSPPVSPALHQIAQVMKALNLDPATSPAPESFSGQATTPFSEVTLPSAAKKSTRTHKPVDIIPPPTSPINRQASFGEAHKPSTLNLTQNSSGLAKLLQANVTPPPDISEPFPSPPSRSLPGENLSVNTDLESRAIAPSSLPLPYSLEDLLTELTDQLELDFIRTYGIAGG